MRLPSHILLAHNVGVVFCVNLLSVHVEIFTTGHLFEVALPHAVLLLACQGRTHVGAHAQIKTHWSGLLLELSSESSVPGVVILLTRLVVQHDWQVDDLVPVAEPCVTSVVLWRVEHGVFFIHDVHLKLFVGLWTAVVFVW